MCCKLLTVIECEIVRGKGADGDPLRRVMQYYSTDGELLAERDEWKEESKDKK